MRPGPIGKYGSILHRGYRSLAARAKHDPAALRQFKKSHLWVETDPAEARAILREHPLMKPGLDGSGRDEGIRFGVLNRRSRLDLNWLVSCLAKLSVKEGGEEAARRLHRYLTAGANANVPAYEITVFHGLVMVRRFDLGAGAYLAPYEYAKSESDLPNASGRYANGSRGQSPSLVCGESTPGVDPEPALERIQFQQRMGFKAIS